MDDNRFFKFVWRLNGLAILVLLLLACGAMVYQTMLRPVFREQTRAQVINVDTTDETLSEDLTFAVIGPVSGHEGFRVEMTREQSFDTEYSSKSTRHSSVNTGFLDVGTGEVNWVFDGTEQLILDIEPLGTARRFQSDRAEAVVDGFLMLVAREDTSGDKRLSRSDELDLVAIGPQGENVVVLARRVSRSFQMWQVGQDQYQVFFEDSEGQKTFAYDAKTRRVRTVAIIDG